MSEATVLRSKRARRSGQGLIELTLTVPVLALLCLATADFARVFYAAIELNTAARSGAQYGSQTVITASDTAGMIAAAQRDAPNVGTVTTDASQCTCNTPSVVATCPTSYCARNPQATFVTVTSQLSFKTAFRFPGVPSTIALAGKAVMAVGQ